MRVIYLNEQNCLFFRIFEFSFFNPNNNTNPSFFKTIHYCHLVYTSRAYLAPQNEGSRTMFIICCCFFLFIDNKDDQTDNGVCPLMCMTQSHECMESFKFDTRRLSSRIECLFYKINNRHHLIAGNSNYLHNCSDLFYILHWKSSRFEKKRF